jgi:hypothetical protein
VSEEERHRVVAARQRTYCCDKSVEPPEYPRWDQCEGVPSSMMAPTSVLDIQSTE